jgi:hypothetical protein
VHVVAERSVVGLLEYELIDLGRMQFRAEDVFVAAVDRDDERIRRQVAEERGFGGRAGIVTWRADDEAVDFALAALRRGVEGTERFDRVTKEVDTYGHLRVERIDVQNPAAERVFSRLFAQGFVGVAEISGKTLRKIVQGEFIALADDDLGLGGGFGRGRATGERTGRASDEQRTLGIVVAVAEEREDTQEIAVGFKGRHGGVGFGQRAGDRLGSVEQRQQLGGLFREGLRRAEVRG